MGPRRGRADPGSPDTYRLPFGGGAACLVVALAIYGFAGDAPPSLDDRSARG